MGRTSWTPSWPALNALPRKPRPRRASPIQKVTLLRDRTVRDDLPHEVQAAAFRVVQESLTNVRRHAADATEITVP